MMFWQQDKEDIPNSANVVDVVFKANANCLPVDHAYVLYAEIAKILPWVKSEPDTAIHSIYGAGSGNGWERPQNADELIYLSRRTRFAIRVPQKKADEVKTKLVDLSVNVAGFALEFTAPTIKELVSYPAVFARSVVAKPEQAEDEFLEDLVKEISVLDIKVKKIICGKDHILQHPDGALCARSLMLADLEAVDSLSLQEHGVGKYQFMGCGVFLPHKTVENIQK